MRALPGKDSGPWVPSQRGHEARPRGETEGPAVAGLDRGGRAEGWLRRHLVVALVLAGIVGGLVGGGASTVGIATSVSRVGAVVDARTSSSGVAGPPAERAPEIVSKLSPSVVELHSRSPGGATTTGSGMVIGANGLVLTNFHVVASAGTHGSVNVRLARGQRSRPAALVGANVSADLAVVRVVGAAGLIPVPLGNSDSLRVGSAVVAMGSPEGLQGTVTVGIISALNRYVRAGGLKTSPAVSAVPAQYRAIQTDAPLNPGSSGGPLVNMQGQVIGMNSSVFEPARGSTSTGIGFAIPVNVAKELISAMIIAHG
jgi:putative serine protease PepD